MADAGLQPMRLERRGSWRSSRCAASVWPTPEISSCSPSTVNRATRLNRPGSTGWSRWRHLPLRQGVSDENRFDGLQIEFGREVHDREIFVVEFPVLLRRVAVAADQVQEQIA